VKIDFLQGMGKLGKRFVLLLDIDRVISADEGEFAREIAESAQAQAVPAAQALPPETAPAEPVPAARP
jgi:purine-binding chemotaxis protein CheW